jgi:DNA-binding CsgD family transcriptional regulator
MDDNMIPLPRDAAARLAAAVPGPDFGQHLLAHIRTAASIANFGAFYVSDMARPDPVLSVWSGEMSDYWFTRNARTILSNDLLRDDIVARVARAQAGGLAVERWHPPADDPRAPIYARDGVIERVTVSSRSGRAGFLSFYLRGAGAGWISEADFARLKQVLPLAHELIGLRHRIVGSEAFHFSARASASALRERNVARFGTLSPREAQVCDLIVRGVTVAGSALELGVSENTIRTLRRRAYRKLGTASALQLVALVLGDAR